ncbi:hypothetical protein L9F63_011686, partial [Diploptera punctata]
SEMVLFNLIAYNFQMKTNSLQFSINDNIHKFGHFAKCVSSAMQKCPTITRSEVTSLYMQTKIMELIRSLHLLT